VRKQIDTSGATISKLPIIEKAKLKTVVTIKALRGSPLFDIFASGPKNGTTPSAEMACVTNQKTSSETRLKQNPCSLYVTLKDHSRFKFETSMIVNCLGNLRKYVSDSDDEITMYVSSKS
jgi:hypothetical protein